MTNDNFKTWIQIGLILSLFYAFSSFLFCDINPENWNVYYRYFSFGFFGVMCIKKLGNYILIKPKP